MIPTNARHWHGAAKDSWFVHLSIETNSQAGPAQWLEPVADEVYNILP
jgi:quercetin dioxygenase-like cupin family protein